MKTSNPSSSRLPGVVVLATIHAKIVARASARSVRGSAIRIVVKNTLKVPLSVRTRRQFSSVSGPGCPGAASLRLPYRTMPSGYTTMKAVPASNPKGSRFARPNHRRAPAATTGGTTWSISVSRVAIAGRLLQPVLLQEGGGLGRPLEEELGAELERVGVVGEGFAPVVKSSRLRHGRLDVLANEGAAGVVGSELLGRFREQIVHEDLGGIWMRCPLQQVDAAEEKHHTILGHNEAERVGLRGSLHTSAANP